MLLFQRTQLIATNLPAEETIRRLACITAFRCKFCGTNRTRAADRFCNQCGKPRENLLAAADGNCAAWGPIRFEGEISRDRFHITPLRTAWNNRSVTPIITGNVHTTASGAEISVSMQPDRFATVFAAAFTLAAALVFVAMVMSGPVSLHLLVPLFLASCAFTGFSLSFAMEVKAALRQLHRLWPPFH